MPAAPLQPPPHLVRSIVVERAPRAAPELGLRRGSLVVSFRTSEAPVITDLGRDATVQVAGLGPMIRAKKAPFSTKAATCLDGRPGRVLQRWTPGRKVTVTVRTGDGSGQYLRRTERVRVVPLNLGESEQAYATTVLGCFSVLADDQ